MKAFGPLLEVLGLLEGVDARVGGGWGIDVLAGRVTRGHADVDVFVPVAAIHDAVQRFASERWITVLDERPWRVVLRSCAGWRVDLNALEYDSEGHGVQRDESGEVEVFPAGMWRELLVDERSVVCLSAEGQRLKHRGYPERSNDGADLTAIEHIHEPSRLDLSVRAADPGDDLDGIETTSDRLYEPLGLWPLPAMTPEEKAAERARAVATLVAGRPALGFCRIERVDDHPHIGQLSVLPEFGRKGIGTSLLAATCAWAVRSGGELLTLTTFETPQFNAPWYQRLGFEELAPPYGIELSQLVDEEAAMAQLGPRVVMSRRLTRRGGRFEERGGEAV